MTSNPIPVLDMKQQIQELWPELQAAFQRVMYSGQFILGPEEKAFEAECANFLRVKHAVGLNSGTDALFIALRTLGIGPGDEVITTPFTFFATAEAISHVGATPVFVDVEEGSFNLDPQQVERAITPRTRAIIPVHLFGRPCDMDRILSIARDRDLKVVEDCAQSFGAQWRGRKCGTLGDLGCFSFFPTKCLSAFGDGGMIATDDDELAGLARALRAHGSRKKYFNELLGYNSRLDELQAAMLRVKLPRLDSWNDLRRSAAQRYGRMLANVHGVTLPEITPDHIFHQYTIRLDRGRDAIQAKLTNAGVATMVYYPVPCHRLPVYRDSHAHLSCPLAERMASEVLSLPMWPEVTEETQQRVVKALCAVLQ